MSNQFSSHQNSNQKQQLTQQQQISQKINSRLQQNFQNNLIQPPTIKVSTIDYNSVKSSKKKSASKSHQLNSPNNNEDRSLLTSQFGMQPGLDLQSKRAMNNTGNKGSPSRGYSPINSKPTLFQVMNKNKENQNNLNDGGTHFKNNTMTPINTNLASDNQSTHLQQQQPTQLAFKSSNNNTSSLQNNNTNISADYYNQTRMLQQPVQQQVNYAGQHQQQQAMDMYTNGTNSLSNSEMRMRSQNGSSPPMDYLQQQQYMQQMYQQQPQMYQMNPMQMQLNHQFQQQYLRGQQFIPQQFHDYGQDYMYQQQQYEQQAMAAAHHDWTQNFQIAPSQLNNGMNSSQYYQNSPSPAPAYLNNPNVSYTDKLNQRKMHQQQRNYSMGPMSTIPSSIQFSPVQNQLMNQKTFGLGGHLDQMKEISFGKELQNVFQDYGHVNLGPQNQSLLQNGTMGMSGNSPNRRGRLKKTIVKRIVRKRNYTVDLTGNNQQYAQNADLNNDQGSKQVKTQYEITTIKRNPDGTESVKIQKMDDDPTLSIIDPQMSTSMKMLAHALNSNIDNKKTPDVSLDTINTTMQKMKDLNIANKTVSNNDLNESISKNKLYTRLVESRHAKNNSSLGIQSRNLNKMNMTEEPNKLLSMVLDIQDVASIQQIDTNQNDCKIFVETINPNKLKDDDGGGSDLNERSDNSPERDLSNPNNNRNGRGSAMSTKSKKEKRKKKQIITILMNKRHRDGRVETKKQCIYKNYGEQFMNQTQLMSKQRQIQELQSQLQNYDLDRSIGSKMLHNKFDRIDQGLITRQSQINSRNAGPVLYSASMGSGMDIHDSIDKGKMLKNYNKSQGSNASRGRHYMDNNGGRNSAQSMHDSIAKLEDQIQQQQQEILKMEQVKEERQKTKLSNISPSQQKTSFLNYTKDYISIDDSGTGTSQAGNTNKGNQKSGRNLKNTDIQQEMRRRSIVDEKTHSLEQKNQIPDRPKTNQAQYKKIKFDDPIEENQDKTSSKKGSTNRSRKQSNQQIERDKEMQSRGSIHRSKKNSSDKKSDQRNRSDSNTNVVLKVPNETTRSIERVNEVTEESKQSDTKSLDTGKDLFRIHNIANMRNQANFKPPSDDWRVAVINKKLAPQNQLQFLDYFKTKNPHLTLQLPKFDFDYYQQFFYHFLFSKNVGFRRELAFQPIPPQLGQLYFLLKRNKSLLNKMTPKFDLYLERGQGQKLLLLSAEKKMMKVNGYYLIYLGGNKGVNRESEHCLGKLRAIDNERDKYVLYDNGESYDSKQLAFEHENLRREMGVFLFRYELCNVGNIRKMRVILPQVMCQAVNETGKVVFNDVDSKAQMRELHNYNMKFTNDEYKPKYHHETILKVFEKFQRKALTEPDQNSIQQINQKFRSLIDNPPSWNPKVNSYVYNFKGRVSEASIKNFQLIPLGYKKPQTDDKDSSSKTGTEKTSSDGRSSGMGKNDLKQDFLIQFGKRSNEEFIMDVQFPMSLMQAFGLALSAFDAD